MASSVFDIFKIGIGPSSSHTFGPMLAACRFSRSVLETDVARQVQQVTCSLYGSLALTGLAHGTDWAVMLGLEGASPDSVEPGEVRLRCERIRNQRRLRLGGERDVRFDPDADFVLCKTEKLSFHSNGLVFTGRNTAGDMLHCGTFYSVGGGTIVECHETNDFSRGRADTAYPFRSAAELFGACREREISIAQLMREREEIFRGPREVRDGLLHIWSAMRASIECGMNASSEPLPGILGVGRRAPRLYRKLRAQGEQGGDRLQVLDWISLYALAVNEENASGGRVVTAPTNGAAGIIPSVLLFFIDFLCTGDKEVAVCDFLLTAGAIGMLYKEQASISGAEVGCQGEVGVAASMAAGALTAVLGGTLDQIENAAEIAMEHHLGLTCDPVGGYVQIPCIERNAMGAIKAINASRLAMNEEGSHLVSLDVIIRVMRETGADMLEKYKETAQGGLAAFVAPC